RGDRIVVCAARDERNVVAVLVEPSAEHATDPARSVDNESHDAQAPIGRNVYAQGLHRGGRMKAEPIVAGFDEARLQRMTEHMTSNYSEPRKIAGCQTTVARGGHLAYFSSLGSMQIEEHRPVPDDAIFRIYSMTKPITSVALMQQYER